MDKLSLAQDSMRCELSLITVLNELRRGLILKSETRSYKALEVFYMTSKCLR